MKPILNFILESINTSTLSELLKSNKYFKAIYSSPKAENDFEKTIQKLGYTVLRIDATKIDDKAEDLYDNDNIIDTINDSEKSVVIIVRNLESADKNQANNLMSLLIDKKFNKNIKNAYSVCIGIRNNKIDDFNKNIPSPVKSKYKETINC
jgi:hypothetical protein